MSDFELPVTDEPLAFLNGEFLPHRQTAIPIWDYGFTMGVTVVESLRTFGGKIRFFDEHLARLSLGMSMLEIQPQESLEEIKTIANSLVQHLRRLIPESECSVGICITPGTHPRFQPSNANSPRSCTTLVYVNPLNPDSWKYKYDQGIHLQIVETREVPSAVVSRQLKNRSRIHYYLAEQQAKKAEADASALLLDVFGNVAEATIASVAMVVGSEILAPPVEDVLGSITAEKTYELAKSLGMRVTRRPIDPEELMQSATEVLWFNTSTTILPVVQINGQRIGNGQPGVVFKKLRKGWLEIEE